MGGLENMENKTQDYLRLLGVRNAGNVPCTSFYYQ